MLDISDEPMMIKLSVQSQLIYFLLLLLEISTKNEMMILLSLFLLGEEPAENSKSLKLGYNVKNNNFKNTIYIRVPETVRTLEYNSHPWTDSAMDPCEYSGKCREVGLNFKFREKGLGLKTVVFPAT